MALTQRLIISSLGFEGCKLPDTVNDLPTPNSYELAAVIYGSLSYDVDLSLMLVDFLAMLGENSPDPSLMMLVSSVTL